MKDQIRVFQLIFFLVLLFGLLAACGSNDPSLTVNQTNAQPTPETDYETQPDEGQIQSGEPTGEAVEATGSETPVPQPIPVTPLTSLSPIWPAPSGFSQSETNFRFLAISDQSNGRVAVSFQSEGYLPRGEYFAAFRGQGIDVPVFPCRILPNLPDRLYCYGPPLLEEYYVNVSIYSREVTLGIWGTEGTAFDPDSLAGIWGTNGTAIIADGLVGPWNTPGLLTSEDGENWIWRASSDGGGWPAAGALEFDFSQAEAIAQAAGLSGLPQPAVLGAYQALSACAQTASEAGAVPELCDGLQYLFPSLTGCDSVSGCVQSCAADLGVGAGESGVPDVGDVMTAIAHVETVPPSCLDLVTRALSNTQIPASIGQVIDRDWLEFGLYALGYSGMDPGYASMDPNAFNENGITPAVLTCAERLQWEGTLLSEEDQAAFFELVTTSQGVILPEDCTNDAFYQGYLGWLQATGNVGFNLQACASAFRWHDSLASAEGLAAFLEFLSGQNEQPDACRSAEVVAIQEEKSLQDQIQACAAAVEVSTFGGWNFDLDDPASLANFWHYYEHLPNVDPNDHFGVPDLELAMLEACAGLDEAYADFMEEYLGQFPDSLMQCVADMNFDRWDLNGRGVLQVRSYWQTVYNNDPSLLSNACKSEEVIAFFNEIETTCNAEVPLEVWLCANALGRGLTDGCGLDKDLDYFVNHHYQQELGYVVEALIAGDNAHMPDACRTEEFYAWLDNYQSSAAEAGGSGGGGNCTTCATALDCSLYPDSVFCGDPPPEDDPFWGLVNQCGAAAEWSRPLDSYQDAADLLSYMALSAPWMRPNSMPFTCSAALALADFPPFPGYLQSLLASYQQGTGVTGNLSFYVPTYLAGSSSSSSDDDGGGYDWQLPPVCACLIGNIPVVINGVCYCIPEN